MVNGKVIRGCGFLVIVGSYIWLDQTFTNNVVNKAKTVYGGLIGAGLGSMYNVSFNSNYRTQGMPTY